MIRSVRAEQQLVASRLTPEQALDNLRAGLDYFLGEISALDIAAQMDVERSRLAELREAIASRLEAEHAILDALHGHTAAGEGDGIAAALGESESLRLLAAPRAGREGRA